MKELLKNSRLYDFYGALLTEDQRAVLEMYYFEDLSLAEIAGMRSTSRAAVYDAIRRAEARLTGYEEKLHLVERFVEQQSQWDSIRDRILEARQIAGSAGESGSTDARRISEILDRILNEAGQIRSEI